MRNKNKTDIESLQNVYDEKIKGIDKKIVEVDILKVELNQKGLDIEEMKKDLALENINTNIRLGIMNSKTGEYLLALISYKRALEKTLIFENYESLMRIIRVLKILFSQKENFKDRIKIDFRDLTYKIKKTLIKCEFSDKEEIKKFTDSIDEFIESLEIPKKK